MFRVHCTVPARGRICDPLWSHESVRSVCSVPSFILSIGSFVRSRCSLWSTSSYCDITWVRSVRLFTRSFVCCLRRSLWLLVLICIGLFGSTSIVLSFIRAFVHPRRSSLFLKKYISRIVESSLTTDVQHLCQKMKDWQTDMLSVGLSSFGTDAEHLW